MELEKLAELRKPFPANQINRLPKPSPAQTEAVKKDYSAGHRCNECGQWHAKNVVHLDYVGHAALTDRLLDVDPTWGWEPLSLGQDGYPVIDKHGGMWIKLTICGVTRLGYGDSQGKTGGNAIKECIGDALRNAAMRFGAALDLWHKGELHSEEDDGNAASKPQAAAKAEENKKPSASIIAAFNNCASLDEVQTLWVGIDPEERSMYVAAKNSAKARFANKEAA